MSVLFAGTTVSFAQDEQGYRYGLSGNNLVFTTVEEALTGGNFRLSVKDGKPGRISVELVDIVAITSCTKTPIPLNSSPFTPYELVSFTKGYAGYQPSEDLQNFDISLRFRDGIELDRPVLGGLLISLVPDEKTENEINVESSILATFAYLPTAGIDKNEYAPALELIAPTIDRVGPEFFPLNMIPNLPFIRSHGDLLLSYALVNTGKIFLETSTQVKVEKLGLFGQPEGELFTQSEAVFLVPMQQTQSTVEIVLTDPTHSQLGIGIYRFTTAAKGVMGDQIETSTSNQQTLIVFPWKQVFIAIVALLLLRKRVLGVFNWLISYARALRDFRYSRSPKATASKGPVFEAVSKIEFSQAQSLVTDAIQGSAVSQPAVQNKTLIKGETARLRSNGPGTVNSEDPRNSSISPSNTSAWSATKSPRSGQKPLYPYWYQPPKKDR